MIRQGAALAAMAVAMIATSADAAATPGCITGTEAGALIVGAMPDVLKAVAARCEAFLPVDATLRAGLDPLVRRLQEEATSTRLLAGVAATKMVGDAGESVSTATKLSMIGDIFAREITNDLKVKDCATIDRAVGLMAPLPAANVAGLVVLILQNQKASKDLNICRAGQP